MTAKDILVEQGAWIDYIYSHLGEFAKIEDQSKAQLVQKAKNVKTILG
jgi:hypothetical protein